MRYVCFRICALQLVLIVFLVPIATSRTATGVCKNSPRAVGPFGALDGPKAPVPISSEISSQLPDVRSIRGLQQTRLGPTGEQIIMYDTKEDSEPDPRVAVVVHGSLTEVYDVSKFVEYGQGAVYATSCEFDLTPSQRALAIAYTLSGDGTGSAFLILTYQRPGQYALVFHRTVAQGRIVLGPHTLELWERTFGKFASLPESSRFECEWCPHRYLLTAFEWRHGEYVKTSSKRTRRAYDPAEISGTPVKIKAVE